MGRPLGSKNQTKKQFCLKGHDTFECGRDNKGYCNICKKESTKGRSRIVKNPKKICIHGHDTSVVGLTIEGKCKECRKISNKKSREKNKEQLAARKHEYYENNKEKICKKRKQYYDEHREEAIIKTKEWKDNNPEKVSAWAKQWRDSHRDILNKQWKERYENKIQFKLSVILRRRLRLAIKKQYKSGSAVNDLGCSISFLKQYLESKFYGNMTWDNYGEVWEIDHTIPLWKFDLNNRDEFLKANNYVNLQPLTKEDHTLKSVKEMEEYWNLQNRKSDNV
jgi:hypothetical protein